MNKTKRPISDNRKKWSTPKVKRLASIAEMTQATLAAPNSDGSFGS